MVGISCAVNSTTRQPRFDARALDTDPVVVVSSPNDSATYMLYLHVSPPKKVVAGMAERSTASKAYSSHLRSFQEKGT